jgi:Ca-activated chloride channel family protein
MSYEIGNPQMLWLLLFAPVALVLMAYSGWSNRNALAKFGSKPTTGQSIRGVASALLLVCGIVFLAIGCADLRWGKTTREVPQKGLEVVFALDVSRSMLAEDARPNRLARAKQQITDMVGEMAGDRIGLVVFAGEAKQAVPLTNHYNDFRQKLESVGPHSVPTGGSQLGVAIQAAADAFISKTSDHKTIVLFTDGEDQESKPVELAEKLNAENELRIFTVGLGDMDKGARIPQRQDASGQFVEHQGQQIWSKLNGSVLRRIATESQAAYIPAGTKRVNMADVYHRYIANLEKSEFETAKINAFIPRFQWFAFPAFACLFFHGWLASSGIRQNSSSAKRSGLSAKSTIPAESPSSKRSNSTKSKVAATAAVLILLPGFAHAQSPTSTNQTVAAKINAANDLVRQNEHGQAIEAFNAIEATKPSDSDALNYNLAVAHYGNSDFDAALTLLAESAKSNNDRIAADSRYNIGNCHFAKSLPLAQQPEASIEELELAVEHYRSAIRLDRTHADARENLERARKLIEQLKQEQQSDPQQGPPEEEQKDQQEQDNEQSDESDQKEQKDKSEESEQSQENQDQSSSKKESSEDANSESDEEGSSGEDQSQKEQTENEQSESNQSSDSETQPEQPSEDQSSDPTEQSQDAQQQQSNGQSDEDAEQNTAEEDGKAAPEGEVTAANESQSEDTKDANKATSLSAAQQNADENGMMSRQEALKLLQAVRDRDMIRRLRQQQRQRSRRVQVEKDW